MGAHTYQLLLDCRFRALYLLQRLLKARLLEAKRLRLRLKLLPLLLERHPLLSLDRLGRGALLLEETLGHLHLAQPVDRPLELLLQVRL